MSKSAISWVLQEQPNTKSILALTVSKFSLQINFAPLIPAAVAPRALLAWGHILPHAPSRW